LASLRAARTAGRKNLNLPLLRRAIATLAAARARAGLFGIAAVILLVLPFVVPNQYWVHVLTIGVVFAILAASWDLLYGVAGILSFGHAAFFGLGAYAATLVNLRWGVNPWIGLVVGGFVSGLLGIVFSAASVRLKGTYLALSTLALAQTLQVMAISFPEITRGTLGLSGYDGLPGLDFIGPSYYYAALVLAGAVVVGLYCLSRFTRIGLAWRAMRNDPTRASTVGIAVAWNRMVVFVLAAFIAGVAGAMYADYIGVMSPAEMDASITANVIAMAVIGGPGTLVGPAAAGLVIEVLNEQLRGLGGAYTGVAVGGVIILFVMFIPGGFVELFQRAVAAVSRPRLTIGEDVGAPTNG